MCREIIHFGLLTHAQPVKAVMKKQRKPNKARKQNKTGAAAAKPQTRRAFLTNLPYIAGGGLAIAGLGYLGISTLRADLAEQDLSIVGSGTPTIVQIHDPTCPVCLALQKETRAAFDMLDDPKLAYRVASISSDVGSAFAYEHGSAHATLLFFDGAGTVTRRVQAPADRAMLLEAFKAHLAQG